MPNIVDDLGQEVSIEYGNPPIFYSQNDSRWASVAYGKNGSGETATISSSGCGPTCAAMVIASLRNSSVTPVTTSSWALANGYRVNGSGTSRSYFVPQLKEYGITARQTDSWSEVTSALQKGNWVIARVGGYWTHGGHYILVYAIDENYVYVNDPNNYPDNTAKRYLNVGLEGTKIAPISKLQLHGSPFWVITTNRPPVNTNSKPYTPETVSTYTQQELRDNKAENTNNTGQIAYKETKISIPVATVDSRTPRYKTVDADPNIARTKSTSLLVVPTLVESPFIILEIGKYTFGSYSKQGSYERNKAKAIVTFPNYMTSVNITKVNGQVNQYTIQMTYQIEAGSDPNLLDKIFSSVGYGTVYITYGDWSAPEFRYRREEAIITKLVSRVDFANSRINYTLNCTSNALKLSASYLSFPAYKSAKPSDIIYNLVYNNAQTSASLLDMFPAFKNKSNFNAFVSRDDAVVEIEGKESIDVLSYINYLVTCMSPSTTDKNAVIREGNYYLTIYENNEKYQLKGEDIGRYFTVRKVLAGDSSIALNSYDTYEVDVGYPGDAMVINFSINNDNSWALLYDYSLQVQEKKYVYNIDDNGNVVMNYSPGLTTSITHRKTTEVQKNWWTQMTEFPITAILTIKGLLRPAMLMSYVRINALFYGQRHISSGLYIITKQQDSIDSGGYRTTLYLTRIAGDLDVLQHSEPVQVIDTRLKDLQDKANLMLTDYDAYLALEHEDLKKAGFILNEEPIKKAEGVNFSTNNKSTFSSAIKGYSNAIDNINEAFSGSANEDLARQLYEREQKEKAASGGRIGSGGGSTSGGGAGVH